MSDELNPDLDVVDAGALAAGVYGASGSIGCLLPGCLFLAFPPVIGGILLGLLGFRTVPWNTPEGMFKFFGLCEGAAYLLLVLLVIVRARRGRRARKALLATLEVGVGAVPSGERS